MKTLDAHDRRRVRHVAVTAHPTAAWTAQQLREAFPWNEAPRYLLHDRDHAFEHMGATAKAMGIEEVVTAPQSPWQNAFVERFIGSVRRDCLDHVIVFNEAGLLRLMTLYRAYYEPSRTHLSLDKDAPIPRPIMPASDGDIVVAVPEVGGLHHRYERRAGLNTAGIAASVARAGSDCQTRPCCYQLSPLSKVANVRHSEFVHSSHPRLEHANGFDRTQDTDRVRASDYPSEVRIGGQIDFLAGTGRAYVHRLATRRRCQRSSVAGVTIKDRHPRRGSTRLAVARNTRSTGVIVARGVVRRRIASSCLRTMIPSSLNSFERERRAANSKSQRNNTYHSDTSTKPPA